MSTYVWLVNWTDQGARSLKETTKRAKAFKENAEKLGVTVKEILWTMGRYDLVLLINAPNDETIRLLALALAIGGNARTETLKAISAQEMDKILMKLP